MKSAEQQYFLNHLPFEVMWLDKSARIVYANDKFCERLGYSKEELERLSIFQINPTVTQVTWQDHWEEAKREKEINFITTHQTSQGNFYEVEVVSHFFSNNGKDLILSIVREITQSSFYKNLLNHTERLIESGGWKLNLQQNTLIVTNEMHRLFGTEDNKNFYPEQLANRFRDPDRFISLINGVKEKAENFDEVFETNESPSRFMRCSAQAIIKGGRIYKIIGACQDVTEQQERESSLRLYKEVIDNAEDLVYVYDRRGKLIHYSNSVVDKLGFSRKELDGFTIYDLDKAIKPEWWAEHFSQIVAEKVLRFDWTVTCKDGTTFPASITANHLCYKGRDLNCAIVRDISERKEYEQKLLHALEEIRDLSERLEMENEYLQEEIFDRSNYQNIVCASDSYKKVLEAADKVAPTDTTVLITGESGTGKELLATAIHNNSLRLERPMIKVNCATLPKDLFESELFGHKKGAFTGALRDKVGKFTLADGGTLFLDEIGELPLALQPKLLRVLQEGEFDLLGDVKTQKVDVRIIAATNRNLEEMVEQGEFREDLYYRLNVYPLHNLPLREREEDIPLLAQFFLDKYSKKAGKHFKRLAKSTVEKLLAYPFPGNIRELENLIERAVILESGNVLKPGDWLPQGKTAPRQKIQSLEEVQRQHIISTLNHTNWRVSGPQGAARLLDMKDKTLFATMKRLGIEKKVVKQ